MALLLTACDKPPQPKYLLIQTVEYPDGRVVTRTYASDVAPTGEWKSP